MSRPVPRGGLGPEWPNEPDDGQASRDQGAQRNGNGAPGQDQQHPYGGPGRSDPAGYGPAGYGQQQPYGGQGYDNQPTQTFNYQGPDDAYPGNGDPRGRNGFEMVSALPAPSFVTVLKRFGAADPGFLSFPRPGWTLALDFPARTAALLPLLDRLDRLVMEHGGRVYLAKDGHVARRAFEAMYPRVAEFRQIRAEIDPAGILGSDLSRRLGL